MSKIDGNAEYLISKLGYFVGLDYIGKYEFSFDKTIPSGRIPAFGTLYSRTTYNMLWDHLVKNPQKVLTEQAWQEYASSHNGQCPYYSDGDGLTSFRTPRLSCYSKGAIGINDVGTYTESTKKSFFSHYHALGKHNNNNGGTFLTTGGNYKDYPLPSVAVGGYWNGSGGGGNSGSSTTDLNMITSLPVDVESGTGDNIVPETITGMWLIVAYLAITDVSSTTLDNMSKGLSEMETRLGEAENTLSNISNIACGFPNYSAGIKISDNTAYTCPSNGVIVVDMTNYNSIDFLSINGIDMFRGNTGQYLSKEDGQYIVKKGDTVKYHQGYNDSNNSYGLATKCRFFPFR